jgi:hypothetical protein
MELLLQYVLACFSFEIANRSLAHGAHLAGQNKTMAQWTADKWSEYGFKSRLDEYCKSLPSLSNTQKSHDLRTHALHRALELTRSRCFPELPGLKLAAPYIPQW